MNPPKEWGDRSVTQRMELQQIAAMTGLSYRRLKRLAAESGWSHLRMSLNFKAREKASDDLCRVLGFGINDLELQLITICRKATHHCGFEVWEDGITPTIALRVITARVDLQKISNGIVKYLKGRMSSKPMQLWS